MIENVKCGGVMLTWCQHFEDEEDPKREIKERGGATGGTCDGSFIGCSGTVDRLVCGEIGGESLGLDNGCDGA